jgi:hypothetical protein
VYALGKLDSLLPDQVLENTNVDGVALRTAWDTLEPAEGEFDWSLVDREIEVAKAHGKEVSLSVVAGFRTPQWVYEAGAAKFGFVWDKTWGAPICSRQHIPIPWDPVFLAKWRGFIRALGKRYDSEPTVPLVKITGLNSFSEEALLPHFREKLIAHGPYQCTSDDDVANWKMRGYTRAKVKLAWKSIVEAFAVTFPHKNLAAMIVPRGLPPIDNEGNLISDSDGDPRAAEELVAEGAEQCSGRFIVQNNGLSAFWNLAPHIAIAHRASLGFQMLGEVTRDPTCRMNRGMRPCDPPQVLRSAVERVLAAGARFLEIYAVDIVNPELEEALAYAHRSLRERAAGVFPREAWQAPAQR